MAGLLGALLGAAPGAAAQEAVPPPAPMYQPLSADQLNQLLGPIALYPDPLIAQLLPAATFPSEIVEADRYLSSGGDPNAADAQPWDASVQAMTRFPNVLQWMDQNLDWTTELGQAFLNQQQDVMNAIQVLRQSAYNLGNLQSTPQEQVINDGGYIEIVPADPQVIYVPVYQPDQVFYVACGGVPFITFGVACAIGPWFAWDFDWGHHDLVYWGRGHARPAGWWHQPWRNRDMGHVTVWRPSYHPGAAVIGRGDRGYGETPMVVTANRRIPVPTPRNEAHNDIHEVRQPAMPAHPAPTVEHFTPAPVEHSQPVNHAEPNGAFIGIQSSQDTRAYSARGQQSVQAVNHAAPSPHSEPRPAPSSGGGGGSGGAHGGGPQRR